MSGIIGLYRTHGGKKPEGTIDSQGQCRPFNGSSDRTKSKTTPATSITGASSQKSKSKRVKANNDSPVSIAPTATTLYNDNSITLTNHAGGWTSDSNNATHGTESSLLTAEIESLNQDVDTANEPVLPSPTPVPSSRAPRPVYVRSKIPHPWSWAAGHKSTSFFRRLQQLSLSHTGNPQLWSWAAGHKTTSFCLRLQKLSLAQRWSWAAGHKRTSFFGRLQQLCRRDSS